MSRRGYGGLGDDPYGSQKGSSNGYGYSNDDGYGSSSHGGSYMTQPGPDDYDPYGDHYGGSSAGSSVAHMHRGAYARNGQQQQQQQSSQSQSQSQPRAAESHAEKELGAVLERIKTDWPAMCRDECVPVQVALQLLDASSVGRAHEYRPFRQLHHYLQDALKAIVHEHHQGFNSSIGTFHKIQGSLQTSQRRLRQLKEGLDHSKANLSTADLELKKLATASHTYDDLLRTLAEIEELRLVPDKLEARISEKQFLSAVDVLHEGLRKIRAPELDNIGALNDLKSYLGNQVSALTEVLVEELHDHLYLKSVYCQERWQALAKMHSADGKERYEKMPTIQPFFDIVEGLELLEPMVENPAKNPEADTFSYIQLLVEALNKLGNLESAVNTIKQRLPVELFGIVVETTSEVDQKHPSALRGGGTAMSGVHIFAGRDTSIRADVIYDLLCTLYAKLEAVAEGHRVLHDVIRATIKRSGMRNQAAMLGGFKELWVLYQNEIRSLLHNYVTTDADQFRSDSAAKASAAKQAVKRDRLFKFSDADPKSIQMTTEYQELDSIIRAAVPGLTSGNRKAPVDSRKQAAGAHRSLIETTIQRSGSRRGHNPGLYDSRSIGPGGNKPLVEPSVFNMSLLLPPTLGFLQRLKNIVPPGSDLATSTLTSFLDNFLVNVFLPQLEETLSKLSDSAFEEADAFQHDPQWIHLAQRPVFKGTSAFFALITAFCKMLDTIPHDQALSGLIITQMIRYYDKCYDWFRSLVSRVQDAGESVMKLGAYLASEPSDFQETLRSLWLAESLDWGTIRKENEYLVQNTTERPVRMADVIPDRDTLSSLATLYTSMRWLSIKIEHLRHITSSDSDSTRTNLQRPPNRRWTLITSVNGAADGSEVYLPMTQETVVGFDSIVSSYRELAMATLLTLHVEIRTQTLHSLALTLSPSKSADIPTNAAHSPYLLTHPVTEPSPSVLRLNADLVSFDEILVRCLREREARYIRTGLAQLMDHYLIANAASIGVMNLFGAARMGVNVLCLSQCLKSVGSDESTVATPGGATTTSGLTRAARYFALFSEGTDTIVKTAEADKAGPDGFTYDELKVLVELYFSEPLANPERGISGVARRRMDETLLKINEVMWQA